MADQDPALPQTEVEPAPPADAGEDAFKAARRKEQRKRWLLILAAVVGVIALLALLYHFLIGIRHVGTDNAYVGADTAQITPLVAGAVAEVRVANTQAVKRGDILVVIDPSDARLMLARAEADLAGARRNLQQTRSTGGALRRR